MVAHDILMGRIEVRKRFARYSALLAARASLVLTSTSESYGVAVVLVVTESSKDQRYTGYMVLWTVGAIKMVKTRKFTVATVLIIQ